jgi:small-conductance mechanosensitive channel
MTDPIILWSNLDNIGKSIVAIITMMLLYFIVRFMVLTRLERIADRTNNDLDDRLVHFFKQFLWLITLFAAIAIVLHINDIEISPLLAGAGIIGVALGFAAKETLADILSGVFLIADRPVRVGDRVKIENIGRHWGAWGDVTDIGLRRTQIRNTDGVIVNYPNSLLSHSVINNFSFENQPVRVRVRFQVGYGADIAKTREIATRAIGACPDVIPDSIQIVVRSLWDDDRGHLLAGVLLEGRYRIEDVRKRTAIRSAVLEHILAALQENNIPLAAQPVELINHHTPT